MKSIKIGIVGATGMVGQAMLECIEKLKLPFHDLRLFASSKSVGKTIYFLGNKYQIEILTLERLRGLDVLFGAVNSEISKQIEPLIKESNVLYIDNSSAFRLRTDVPLVIPEINMHSVSKHSIISNPNCSTILTLMSIYPIHQLFRVKRMIISTYQAVSGAGIHGMDSLINEIQEYPGEPNFLFFGQSILNNCIPHIGNLLEDGSTSEEIKLLNESKKILGIPHLDVVCTCVRVPVLRSHSISIVCETEEEIDFDQLLKQYDQMPGVKVCLIPPTPIQSSNQFDVLVGRLRVHSQSASSISLWCCGDQIYKGAAYNAIQIAQSYFSQDKDVV